MNQLLEKLKNQAIIKVNNPTVNSDGKVICDNWEEVISISKFAELIVRECVKTGKELYDECEPWGGIEGLYEHFGVEEC